MSLDPAASPWPGVIASVAICLWIAVIGALLAYAVFRDRPRLVWPFYAPIVGVAVVLLVTNLAAYVMPGAPSAWFGLLLPFAVGLVAARRSGPLRPLPQGSRAVLLALAAVAIAVFVLAYTNRIHGFFDAPTWHQAVAQRLARGEFPPVTPYGVDAGIGYHYGADLLTASIVSTTGAPPWTAADALSTLLIVGLVLGVAGFAFDVGASLPFSLAIGLTMGWFHGAISLGYRPGSLERLVFLEPPPVLLPGFVWAHWLQRPLAICLVVLVAAALQAGAARRHALVLGAGAGVLALGDASVMIFACATLALVGVVRLVRLRGRERLFLAGALGASALLVALAGGPVSDAIFDRGGTAGTVHVAWEPMVRDLAPVREVEHGLVGVGITPLIAIGALAAFRQRNWGLGFLTAAGAIGLLEAQLIQSRFYMA